jgi:predicted RecB family nuclease
MPFSFTPSLFYKFSTCPHWIWHDLFGNPINKIEVPALAQKLIEQGVLHEEEYIKNLTFVSVTSKSPDEAFAATRALMQSGADLIYQGEIQYEADGVLYHGRPDLLEKRHGHSASGDHYYAPVDIKSSSKLDKKHKLQLTLYANILEHIQGVYPCETAIINRDHKSIPFTISIKPLLLS